MDPVGAIVATSESGNLQCGAGLPKPAAGPAAQEVPEYESLDKGAAEPFNSVQSVALFEHPRASVNLASMMRRVPIYQDR
jgi:hypothetical protein